MNKFVLLGRRVTGFLRSFFMGKTTRNKFFKELKSVDISTYVKRVISDAVLMNSIPSPTENEKLRMDFIMQRLNEYGISNIEIDKWGNVAALFPAYGTQKDFILIVAEIGDSDYTPIENSIRLTEDKAFGKGLGEKSLGAATLLVFAEYAQATGYHLNKNILLLFTKSISVDELEEAFRGFLNSWAKNISCSILIKGLNLGVIESRQVGSYHLVIDVKTAVHELLEPGVTASAAAILGLIASQISGISWDEKHTAMVNIARMESGIGFGHWPSEGFMELEIVSENENMLETIKNAIMGTISKVSSGSNAKIDVTIKSRHSVGDSMKNAPLSDALRNILIQLKVKPETGIISEKISILNEIGIPATAIGISNGTSTNLEESVDLASIETGLRQLLMIIENCSTMKETRGQEKS